MCVCVCVCVFSRDCIRIDHVMISHPLPHVKRGGRLQAFPNAIQPGAILNMLEQRAGRRGGFMCFHDLYVPVHGVMAHML